MHSANNEKIKLLEQGEFLSCPLNNQICLHLVTYLTVGVYKQLRNPDPLDLNKNSLSGILMSMRCIDSFIQKPLDKITIEDIDAFVYAHRKGEITKFETRVASRKNGKLSLKIIDSGVPRSMHELDRYIGEFKRLFKVYRQYLLYEVKDLSRANSFEWIFDYKCPKVKHRYEDFPVLTLNQIIKLADSMRKPEYAARILVSINLMGRKCEIAELRFSDIIRRDDGSVWVQLPDIKKHSSAKVPVELYEYAKKRLDSYLNSLGDLDADEKVFPSKDPAFAKQVRKMSQCLFGRAGVVTPKTLRKLGVCVARELGISRDKVEDIGGWKRNSRVLEHYFKRTGVSASVETNAKIDKGLYADVYARLDKTKSENDELKEGMVAMRNVMIKLLQEKGQLSQSDLESVGQLYSSIK